MLRKLYHDEGLREPNVTENKILTEPAWEIGTINPSINTAVRSCRDIRLRHYRYYYKMIIRLDLPDVRVCVQHGSHESGAGPGHAADEYQWHVPVIRVDLHIRVSDEFLKENHVCACV